MAPPPPAGALSPPTGGLTKLKELNLYETQITDAGCAALASALDNDALPALEKLFLEMTLASDASTAAVYEALERCELQRLGLERLSRLRLSRLCLIQ